VAAETDQANPLNASLGTARNAQLAPKRISVTLRVEIYADFVKSSAWIAVNECAEETEMQPELFELSSRPVQAETSEEPRSTFLEKTFVTLRLDQTIGLSLILLVFFVVIFAWGVETGKRSSVANRVAAVAAVPVAVQTMPVTTAGGKPVAVSQAAPNEVSDVIPVEVPIPVTAMPKPVAKVAVPKGKYTIQHVTYVTQSAADREIQKLFQKGHPSFVIPSGKHLQVCIASFETRKEAMELLKTLRSQKLVSSDAYIRPITR